MKSESEVHFEGKIAQKVIVTNGDKVLLVQDPREGRSIWELPGGRMNKDEDPYEAIKREFFEEMGVQLNVHGVVHMEQFFQYSDNKNAFVIIYNGSLTNPDEEFKLADEEVSQVDWFTPDEIAELNLFPEYERALSVYYQLKALSKSL